MNNDNEIYAVLKDFDNYAISNYGDVFNIKTNRVMKIDFNRKYPAVGIPKKGDDTSQIIHRLLAVTFIPNPLNLPMIDHIDRNKHNNSLENLRWISASNNNRNKDKKLNSTSKYYGVCYRKDTKKFKAQILINNIKKGLGSFETEDEAGIAFNNYIISNPVLTEFYVLNVIN